MFIPRLTLIFWYFPPYLYARTSEAAEKPVSKNLLVPALISKSWFCNFSPCFTIRSSGWQHNAPPLSIPHPAPHRHWLPTGGANRRVTALQCSISPEPRHRPGSPTWVSVTIHHHIWLKPWQDLSSTSTLQVCLKEGSGWTGVSQCELSSSRERSYPEVQKLSYINQAKHSLMFYSIPEH